VKTPTLLGCILAHLLCATLTSEVSMNSRCLHIVLFEPEIAENTGSVGRTCVALGAKLWLVRPLGFRLDDRRRRRAGLDYWESLDWEVADNWDALAQRLEGRRFWFFTKTAERVYTEAGFAAGDVLVFGSESRGLPRAILEKGDRHLLPEGPSGCFAQKVPVPFFQQCLRIPMRPEARSLNLAVSVAVAAYEARRQMSLTRLSSGGREEFVGPVLKEKCDDGQTG